MEYLFTATDLVDRGKTTYAAIEKIKTWLPEKELPNLQDEHIVLFLTSCDNDIENTKYTITSYFKIKKSAPEIFNNWDIDTPELQQVSKILAVSSIPTRTDENNVIHFFKLLDPNYSNFHLQHIMKLAYMIVDVTQKENPPDGLIVVIDMKGFGLMHLTKFRPMLIKKFFQYLQRGMPLKMLRIHVLNIVYFFDKVLSMLKPFMKTELLSMIHTHQSNTDMNEFFEKYVPAKCMPKDYGGDLPSVEELNLKTIEQFRELKPFYEAEEAMRKKHEE